MTDRPDVRPLFRLATRRTHIAKSVDEEFRHHFEAAVEYLEAGGMHRADAEDEARRRFGSVSIYRRECVSIDRQRQRRKNVMDFIDSVLQDLRFTARTIRRHPGFAISIVMTLCLGIGASAAIFTVIDATMLRPLPYAHADELVEVGWTLQSGFTAPSISATSLAAAREAAPFPVAAAESRTVARTDVTPPERFRVAAVEPALFGVLGVSVIRGRALDTSDLSGEHGPVIALAKDYAQRAFPDGAVGQRLRIDDVPFTVVGVIADGSRLPWFSDIQGWVPMSDMGVTQGFHMPTVRVYIAGRARGQTVETATAALNERVVRLAESGAITGAVGAKVSRLEPHQNADAKRALWMLMGAVGLLWLIAIVNGTNLFLVRNSARDAELRVRLALGASRGRVARQIATEAVVLALVAGVLSAAVAAGGIQVLREFLPREIVAFSAHDVEVTGRVLLFVFGVATLSGVLFGVAPAIRAAASGRNGGLGLRTVTVGRGTRLFRNILVVGEIAIAIPLLVGAGLLGRSFMQLNNVERGFDASDVLTMSVSLPTDRYPGGEQRVRFRDAVLERLRATPGVASATEGSAVPSHASFAFGGDSIQIDDGTWTRLGDEGTWLAPVNVDESYFETLRIPVVAGRTFTASDRGSRDVAIIDEGLADKLFPSGGAVGRQIRFSPTAQWRTIVGVAGDALLLSPVGSPDAHFLDTQQTAYERYLPVSSTSASAYQTFAMRTSGGVVEANVLRSIVADIDPLLPVSEVSTLEADYGDTIAKPRFNSLLMLLLAGVATLLTIVGVYGVLAFSVSQRTREIGIRMALGAPRGAVRRAVVLQAARLGAIGVAIGVAGATWASGVLRTLLYEIAPTDVATFAAVGLLMLLTAVAAAMAPSRRATRVDPMVALRVE